METGHRAVLFFDLLGMKSMIHNDVFTASRQLNELSLLLPRATQGKNWEAGFHLSDSTFLVHRHVSGIIRDSVELYHWLFEYDATDLGLPAFVFGIDDPQDYKQEGLMCLPRGSIAVGEVKFVPKINWVPGIGFVRSEREVLIDYRKLGHPINSISIREQSETLLLVDGALFVKKECNNEEIMGIVPLDPDGGLDVIHVGEIGNVTGPAIVEAVLNSEARGFKGPRLLLSRSVLVPEELDKWVRPIPGCDVRDVLWTADFSDKDRTIRHLHKVAQFWLSHRGCNENIRIHYDSFMCLAIAGTYAVLEHYDSAQDITSLFEPILETAIKEKPLSENDVFIVASYALCANRTPFSNEYLNHYIDSILASPVNLNELADTPLRSQKF
jgi:hypothetical protein